MARIFLSIAFFFSIFTLPWWVSVLLSIFLLALFQAGIMVIVGGIMMDILFGAPVDILSGFQYLYTALFLFLALLTLYLKARVSD